MSDVKQLSTKDDLAILVYARTFRLTTDTAGAHIPNVGLVQRVELAKAAQRLANAGWLREVSHTLGSSKWNTYAITDAGRAVAREHEQRPKLTLDVARSLSSEDLQSVYGDLLLAQVQLRHREAVAGLARGALACMGFEFTGRAGWHIIAMAVPEEPASRLGFVDTARGIAVETALCLTEAQVEAVTIPGQEEGPQMSGAAAWTHPDAGEGHQAQSPVGWRQLLIDLRVDVQGSTVTGIDPKLLDARVTWWGLRTCYQMTGAPGYIDLRGLETERQRPGAWPATSGTRRAMRAIGIAWLADVCRRLAAVVWPNTPLVALETAQITENVEGAICEIRRVQAIRRDSRQVTYARSALESAVCHVTSKVVQDALREALVYRIADLSGDYSSTMVIGTRWTDLVDTLLEAVLETVLDPTAEALSVALRPYAHRYNEYVMFEPMLRSLGRQTAQVILHEIACEARGVEQRIIEAYYAQGPVRVDIPIVPKLEVVP